MEKLSLLYPLYIIWYYCTELTGGLTCVSGVVFSEFIWFSVLPPTHCIWWDTDMRVDYIGKDYLICEVHVTVVMVLCIFLLG